MSVFDIVQPEALKAVELYDDNGRHLLRVCECTMRREMDLFKSISEDGKIVWSDEPAKTVGNIAFMVINDSDDKNFIGSLWNGVFLGKKYAIDVTYENNPTFTYPPTPISEMKISVTGGDVVLANIAFDHVSANDEHMDIKEKDTHISDLSPARIALWSDVRTDVQCGDKTILGDYINSMCIICKDGKIYGEINFIESEEWEVPAELFTEKSKIRFGISLGGSEVVWIIDSINVNFELSGDNETDYPVIKVIKTKFCCEGYADSK